MSITNKGLSLNLTSPLSRLRDMLIQIRDNLFKRDRALRYYILHKADILWPQCRATFPMCVELRSMWNKHLLRVRSRVVQD